VKRVFLLAGVLGAVAGWAAETTIDPANRRINGNLTVVGTTTLTGAATLTGTVPVLKSDLIDAGNINVQGNVSIVGKIPALRADVVDAGQLFVQGFGPVTRIIPFTTAAIDFASGTIVCADSAGTTVTGARTTDGCFVGMPSTLTGAGTGLHHSFTCYVSASDTVKIRACAAGTADDPGSVTFTGFVISSAQ
jgi:hypothetical protein